MKKEDLVRIINTLHALVEKAQSERDTCLSCDQDEDMHADDCDMEWLEQEIDEAQGDA
jgi:hypothetical protein